MTSPRLGVVRDSMLKNPLLIKAPLGRARTRGLSIPGGDFTFGIASNSLRNDDDAQILLNQSTSEAFAEHPDFVTFTQHPDFVTLNRNAVRFGVATAKDLRQYRSQLGENMARSPAPGRRRDEASRTPLALPDITFGVAYRATSPIADLLSYQYARSWFEEQSRNQTKTQTSNQNRRIKPGHVAETRTSLLRKNIAETRTSLLRSLPVLQTRFDPPQFAKVAPALDTFSDLEVRQRAFRAHRSNPEIQRGHQAQGTT